VHLPLLPFLFSKIKARVRGPHFGRIAYLKDGTLKIQHLTPTPLFLTPSNLVSGITKPPTFIFASS
jgi:hypothetical protein